MSDANRTLAEVVLRSHAIDEEGGFVRARVDLAMSHDATTALLMDRFRRLGGKLWDPSRVMLVADHFSPPPNAERATILRQFLDFASTLEGVDLRQHEGICHQLMVEDPRMVPGALVVGADSHTTTVGGLGCLATGVGSTDMLRILLTGESWFRIPAAIRVDVSGRLAGVALGRDVALEMLGRLGERGANYRSLEIWDRDGGLSMDDRFAICNAAVEAGAKCGIVVPDEVTNEYLEVRGAVDYEPLPVSADARYESTMEIDLSQLEPQVAVPESPCNVTKVRHLEGIAINRAYIGSCASGRLSDLQSAAEVLSGNRVHKSVQMVVIPSSRKIYLEAMRQGLIEVFVEAGAQVAPPSCGPCGGITNGLLAEGEVCVSTSTRNYRGRMGHPRSKTYLASARTVALSALRGELSA